MIAEQMAGHVVQWEEPALQRLRESKRVNGQVVGITSEVRVLLVRKVKSDERCRGDHQPHPGVSGQRAARIRHVCRKVMIISPPRIQPISSGLKPYVAIW